MRVTNINDIDLNLYPFDYDLTMAVLLAHEDGTVYHRYGGRTDVSPMFMETLLDIMKRGLESHRAYEQSKSPPKRTAPETVTELVESQLRGKMNPIHGCYHCHYVREARLYRDAKARHWTPDQFWTWPPSERLGLVMNQHRQYVVEEVLPGTLAESAGFKPGDVLVALDGARTLTKYDVQWVLENLPHEQVDLPWRAERDGAFREGVMSLPAAWKVGDPHEYSWRVNNVYTQHMRKILPTPGLMGDALSAEELGALPVSSPFGLRVTGLNGGTHLAGVRLGDVVLDAGQSEPFAKLEDFYKYCELKRQAKEDISLHLLRGAGDMRLMVNLNYLNYTSIEQSPELILGFIAQELAAGRGLRVGNVTDGSRAEITGLRHGDRIVTVDNQELKTFKALEKHLGNKAPGEMLTLQVRRDDHVLQFAYALAEKISAFSDLAQLSQPVTRAGQEVECVVSLNLSPGQYVYSVRHKGTGVPSRVEFRGVGFELVGELGQPQAREVDNPGLPASWVLEGSVQFVQRLRVLDPDEFSLAVRVYAQVCDAVSCSEYLDQAKTDGETRKFTSLEGKFDSPGL